MAGLPPANALSTGEPRALRRDLLHLLGLTLLALSQPLFAVLGEQATFFVAHRAERPALLLWVAAVTLAPWAGLAVVEGALSLAGARARRAGHLLLVAALAGLSLMPWLNRVLPAHGAWSVAAAAAAGAAFTAAYARLKAVGSFTTFVALGSLLLPVLFLTVTPAARLRPASPAIVQTSPPRHPHPVVMVVFDELSLVSLLDGRERIDARRFPHFAELASVSDWYVAAGAVADGTNNALPSLLDGRRPRQGGRLPVHASFPRNLFTLLAGSHRLNVHETITWLCPRELCAVPETPLPRVMAGLLVDTAVVYGHVVAPPPLRRRLPGIGQGWGGFLAAAAAPPAAAAPAGLETKDWFRAVGDQMYGDRRQVFRGFVESIPSGGAPALSFLHILLPHVPYTYLPSTRAYAPAALRGLTGEGEDWSHDEWAVREGQQRYLLQLAAVDALVGELIVALRRDGLFDSALVVLTADHGVAFRPGAGRRAVSRENAAEIVPVPLFVKRPGQTAGRIVHRPAELVDVLPTIADVLGVDVPWPMDGSSLLAPPRAPLRSRRVFRWSGESVDLPVALDLEPVLRRQLALFGSGRDPRRLYALGLHPDLLGGHAAPAAAAPAAVRVEIDATPGRPGGRGEPVPARLTGSVEPAPDAPPPLDLAIAAGGTVVALTRTYEHQGRHYFSAMLPETALAGGAALEVFVVRRAPDGRPRLVATVSAGRSERRIVGAAGGGEAVRGHEEGADAAPLRAGVLAGHVDHVRVLPAIVVFSGWVAESGSRRPASEVALFIRGRQAASALPNEVRPDVARVTGTESLRQSGFTLAVERRALDGALPHEVRIVGFAAGVAGELRPAVDGLCALAGLRWEHDRLRPPVAAPAVPPTAVATGAPTGAAGRPVGVVDSATEESGCLRLLGWAYDPERDGAPERMLVTAGEWVVARGVVSQPRDDVAAALATPGARMSGFELVVPIEAFGGPWRDRLRVFAVGRGGASVLPPFLGGSPSVAAAP